VDETTPTPDRPCRSCGTALVPAQDWCLECGTAAPGRLTGPSRAGFRAAATIVSTVLVLVGGAVAACALCCGAPALLVAGVAVGVASAVSLAGGALVLALVLAWAVLTGRVGPRRRMLTTSTPRASGRRSCCAVDAES